MTTPTSSNLQLPAPAPLLTRGGWSAFIVALIVVLWQTGVVPSVEMALELLPIAGAPFFSALGIRLAGS